MGDNRFFGFVIDLIMKKRARNLLAVLVSIVGTILSLYVGVYKLIILNLIGFVSRLNTGTLTIPFVLRSIACILVSMTLGGAIWVACDIVASKIRGYD